jgi:hypothetical protein
MSSTAEVRSFVFKLDFGGYLFAAISQATYQRLIHEVFLKASNDDLQTRKQLLKKRK